TSGGTSMSGGRTSWTARRSNTRSATTSSRICLRATRFQVLYRRWLSEAETALEVLSSQATADAVERGAGDVKCHVLPFSYRHLSPLVDVTRPRSKGAEEGEETPARPRPLFESSPSLRNAIAEPVG